MTGKSTIRDHAERILEIVAGYGRISTMPAFDDSVWCNTLAKISWLSRAGATDARASFIAKRRS